MIIGIHGKAQSGKDTLGDLIYRKAEETGKKVVLLSFAEPVKQLLMSMYVLLTKTCTQEYSALEAEGAIMIKLLREIPSSASGKRMEYTLSDRCFDHVMDNREMGREEFLSASTTLINEILRSGN